MDKEAQKRVAQVLWFLDLSRLSEYPTQRHLGSAEEVLKQMEMLGYRKLPKDKPPICQKCGSLILLSQDESGLRADCGCTGTPIDFPIDNRWSKPKGKQT